MPTDTMYAAAVSSGSSPFEPRCAMLKGREVCKGCLLPSSLLGSGYIGLAAHPAMKDSNNRGTKPVKCHDLK